MGSSKPKVFENDGDDCADNYARSKENVVAQGTALLTLVDERGEIFSLLVVVLVEGLQSVYAIHLLLG